MTGLLIERDRKEQAQGVLRHLYRNMKRGVIPNRFPDNYQTSDASLWFVYAAGRTGRWGEDSFVAEIRPVIAEILQDYPRSPVATLDGPLITVRPGTAWMDTQFTPRAGKPVEINALWINALNEAESMGIIPPVSVESARSAFQVFWNEEAQCLYDCIDPFDASIRPNQIFALALGFIDRPRSDAALATVRNLLFTPYGLRTLSPGDPKYRGVFDGDSSYHNGCVWPWLTGWSAKRSSATAWKNSGSRLSSPLSFPISGKPGAGYIWKFSMAISRVPAPRVHRTGMECCRDRPGLPGWFLLHRE